MTRDWLLTLLAMSPYLLTATIVVLAVIGNVIRKRMQNERIRRAAETSAPLRRSESVVGVVGKE